MSFAAVPIVVLPARREAEHSCCLVGETGSPPCPRGPQKPLQAAGSCVGWGAPARGRPRQQPALTFLQGQQRDGSAQAAAAQAHQVWLLRLHLQPLACVYQVQGAVLQGTEQDGSGLCEAAHEPTKLGRGLTPHVPFLAPLQLSASRDRSCLCCCCAQQKQFVHLYRFLTFPWHRMRGEGCS